MRAVERPRLLPAPTLARGVDTALCEPSPWLSGRDQSEAAAISDKYPRSAEREGATCCADRGFGLWPNLSALGGQPPQWTSTLECFRGHLIASGAKTL